MFFASSLAFCCFVFAICQFDGIWPHAFRAVIAAASFVVMFLPEGPTRRWRGLETPILLTLAGLMTGLVGALHPALGMTAAVALSLVALTLGYGRQPVTTGVMTVACAWPVLVLSQSAIGAGLTLRVGEAMESALARAGSSPIVGGPKTIAFL